MKHSTVCAASLLGGIVIGSALAMLFTPQSGDELRSMIREKFNREVDKAKEEIDKVKRDFEQMRCHCNDSEK